MVDNTNSQAKSRIDFTSKHVLVVDDFAQHMDLMCKMLRRIGFEKIQQARNPAEAIAHCQDYNFDIIFCDYNMGEGKNGKQLLQELRYTKQVKFDCIFIMISAETSREVVMGAIETEPEGYIAKPFNEAMLRRKIERLMDKQACLASINQAIENRDYEAAIELCHVNAERHPRHHSWCMKTAAELHLKLDQYNLAEKIFTSVLADRVLDWALLGLARTFLYQGKVEQAMGELQQVLVLNNNCVPAYDLLADCHQKMNDPRSVQSHLAKAATISPNSTIRQEQLGDVCTVNEDFEGAASAYKQSLKSAKHSIEESPDNYIKLAGAITDSMAGDLSKHDSEKVFETQKVLSEMDKRFDKEGETEARKDMVNVRLYLKQQNPDRAIELLQEMEANDLVCNDQLSPLAVYEYGRTLHSLGHEERAIEVLTPLIELEELADTHRAMIRGLIERSNTGDPVGRASELNEKGAALYEQDQIEDSIEKFSEASRLSPCNVVINLNLSQALIRCMEQGSINPELYKQSKECFEKLGDIENNSRHYARFANLSQRFQALSVEQPRMN